MPKGHLENGESLIDCAIRETFEETNIVIYYNQFYRELSNFEIIAHTKKLGLEVIKTFEFSNNLYYELGYETNKIRSK